MWTPSRRGGYRSAGAPPAVADLGPTPRAGLRLEVGRLEEAAAVETDGHKVAGWVAHGAGGYLAVWFGFGRRHRYHDASVAAPKDSIVDTDAAQSVRFADRGVAPLAIVRRRLLAALAVVTGIALIVWVGRDGYRDSADGAVSLLDAFYYSTVSVTTTGYGDIVPVSPMARLVTAVVITPMRAAFLVLVVSTTVEVLTEASRYEFRVRRWRKTVHDHYVICGYGTKGRSAAQLLVSQGIDPARVVVVEPDRLAVAEANRKGFVVVQGDATREVHLREAGAESAKAIIVAVDRDDTAVLATLTALNLNGDARVVVAVREAENAPLLRRSGASSVIISDEATGQLLGMAVESPDHAKMIEDLLMVGEGIELDERAIRDDQIGRATPPGVIAVLRGGRFLPAPVYDLEAGDRLLGVRGSENGK